MQTTFRAACELKNKVRIALLLTALLAFVPVLIAAQEHAPAGQEHATEGEHHDESIGGMLKGLVWPVANFVIFVGVLYYFFNSPLKDYLANRSSSIRKDLVEAAELKSTATAQLAAIESKLQALPGEVNALRARGADEIKAEEQRIAVAAAAERERLLEQTRKEIELQVCRCSWPPSDSRKKSPRTIRRDWSIAISIR
jgi:F0F1-type ATP synthase membrane subunit b/b'